MIRWLTATVAVIALGLVGTADAGITSTIKFDVPGSTSTFPESINAAGTVTGIYYDAIGGPHGFVRAPDGTITKFDVPGSTTCGGPGPPTCTSATAINNAGTIAGSYADSAGGPHGFLRAPDGTITTFDAFDSIRYTYVFAINAAGTVVGIYNDDTGAPHCFLRASDGTITRFDLPDQQCSLGAGPLSSIDATGALPGRYVDPITGVQHGFVRAPDGTITTFDPPGSVGINVVVINDGGTIAGSYFDATSEHGFVRAPDGTITIFDVGPGSYGVAGINAAETIVGNLNDSSGNHGFVRAPDGTITRIDVPGADRTDPPFSINDVGTVTGIYYDASGGPHGFIFFNDSALISNLITTVTGLGFQSGVTLLQNALSKVAAGQTTPVCNELNAFIHQTQARSGKSLTVDQANQLITAANEIKAALGCP